MIEIIKKWSHWDVPCQNRLIIVSDIGAGIVEPSGSGLAPIDIIINSNVLPLLKGKGANPGVIYPINKIVYGFQLLKDTQGVTIIWYLDNALKLKYCNSSVL